MTATREMTSNERGERIQELGDKIFDAQDFTMDEMREYTKLTNEAVLSQSRGPGRPPVGEPVNVRLGDLLPRVDEFAAIHGGMSRAAAIRELVSRGLDL